MNKKILFLVAMVLVVVGLTACGEKEEVTYDASGNPISVVKEDDNKGKNTDKVVDSTDPYVANIPNEILDFYKTKVEEIEKKHRDTQTQLLELDPSTDISQLTNLKYDLIFLNDDNIPELIVTNPGYYTALYTYDAGQVIYAMKDEVFPDDESGWGYGAGGNAGYEFIPKGNVVRNYDNDYAGLIRYTSIFELDKNTHQLVSKLDKELYEAHFNDKNNNGKVDDDEMEEFIEEPTYYYGDKKITAEEYASYVPNGAYDTLEGTKSYSEIISALDSLINQK